MGNWISGDCKSKAAQKPQAQAKSSGFRLIPDNYKTFDDLTKDLRRGGFENCEVILAVDLTGSNREQGARTFKGRDLHYPHEAPTPTTLSPAPAPASAASTVYPPLHAVTPSAPPPYEAAVMTPSSVSKASDGASHPSAALSFEKLNPYQQVMTTMSSALQALNPAKRIHVVGFGDMLTEDHSVFCLRRRAQGETKSSIVHNLSDCQPCHGVEEVLQAYKDALPHTVKSGPTSFVPVIDLAIRHAKTEHKYCFVFLIGDGAVTNAQANANAIIEASDYPISFSMIGVGDGPWTAAQVFDDELPQRKFDNWQTLIFEDKMKECGNNPLRFATHALMEAPDQLRAMHALGYFKIH